MKFSKLIGLIGCVYCIQNLSAQKISEIEKSELRKDKYGMTSYVFGLISNGENRIADKDSLIKLQKLHLKNILRLESEGKLVVAGPFYNTDTLRGIFVFNTDSISLAQEWLSSDPMVQCGHLKIDLYPWYSSATLQLIPKMHADIEETSILE